MNWKYVSQLLLGLAVVGLSGLFLYQYFQSERPSDLTGEPTWKQELTEATAAVALPTEHVISSGETLWAVAQRYYSSGYNWVDISRVNNLDSPDLVFAGTKLTIPKVTPLTPTTGVIKPTVTEAKITQDSYTVLASDSLWIIALRAYGDGYRYLDIARANNLANPDIIHRGNVLKIPR